MSVYSGFVSRSLETSYNRAVSNMLCLLQLKVAKTLKGGNTSISHITPYLFLESFSDLDLSKYFHRFYAKICTLEESKHLFPLFSNSLKDLAAHYEVSQENIAATPATTLMNDSSGFSDSSFHDRLYQPVAYTTY